MISVNYTQFRANMKRYLDMVTEDFETVTVTRKENQNVVILSESAYNNLIENAYLTSGKANFDWLMDSKQQYQKGSVKKRSLIGAEDE